MQTLTFSCPVVCVPYTAVLATRSMEGKWELLTVHLKVIRVQLVDEVMCTWYKSYICTCTMDKE